MAPSEEKMNTYTTPFYERAVNMEHGISSHKISSRDNLLFDYVLCITKNADNKDSQLDLSGTKPPQSPLRVPITGDGPQTKAQGLAPSPPSLIHHQVLLTCLLIVS